MYENIRLHFSSAELLGLKAWKTLEMDKKLEDLGFNPLQIKPAATSVISRLYQP